MLANPSASKQPVDTKELREKQALARSQLMRSNAGYIPAFAVQQRRHFFNAKVDKTAMQTHEYSCALETCFGKLHSMKRKWRSSAVL